MSDKSCDALKSVLTRVIDSADGYKEAAEATENSRFATVFRRRAEERRTFASELRAALAAAGAEVDDDGSLLAGAHRIFMNLKAKMDDDDEAVLEEVIRGENALIEEYEDALKDMPATASSRAMLENQLSNVRQQVADARGAEQLVD